MIADQAKEGAHARGDSLEEKKIDINYIIHNLTIDIDASDSITPEKL